MERPEMTISEFLDFCGIGSIRLVKCLKVGFGTWPAEQIIWLFDHELLRIKHLGRKSLLEYKALLPEFEKKLSLIYQDNDNVVRCPHCERVIK